MNSLLDTHTLIWFLNGDKDTTDKAKIEIETKPERNYVSIASIWEIAIKISIGKLELKTSFENFINQIEINSFQILPVPTTDALIIAILPFHHRHPFDRMIITQAKNNNLKVLTKDIIFDGYDVKILW